MKKQETKVVVITGASSGIGRAIADELSLHNFIVYDISRTVHENKNIKGAYSCNVNDTEKMKSILDEIYDKEGKVNVFINNAGFGIAGAVEHASREKIYALVETNLSAVMALSSLAIKYLKKSGGGNIVNISSVGGVIPLPYQAVYSATKAGVDIFSKALANEVKDFNIKVTSILPGDTKTSFTQNRIIENDIQDEKYKKSVEKSIKKAEKEEQEGASPNKVAKVIYKVLLKKNPPLRKTVGFSYKLIVFAQKILPTRFVNYLVRKLYI